MNIFLDANILVEAVKGKVTLDIKYNIYYINPIVYAEVLYGILYVGRREKSFKDYLEYIEAGFIGISMETARIFVKEKVRLNNLGLPLPDNDLMIAASCLEYDMPIWTLNLKHFKRIKSLKFQ